MRGTAVETLRDYARSSGLSVEEAIEEAVGAYWLPLAVRGSDDYTERERERITRRAIATLEARANRLRESSGLEEEREANGLTVARLLAYLLRRRAGELRTGGAYLPDNWLRQIEGVAEILESADTLVALVSGLKNGNRNRKS